MPAAALAESVDRNRSLDEFAAASEEADESDTAETAGSDDTAQTAETGERDATGAGDDSRLPDPSTVEPLSPTYAAGREAACVECDASVAVRWRGSDGYVCADCKEW